MHERAPLPEQIFQCHLAEYNECTLFYLKKFAKEKYNIQEWNQEDVYKRLRNFVKDDGKRIYRYQNKSEEAKYNSASIRTVQGNI